MQSLKLINTAAKDAAKIVNRLREFYRNRDKNEVFVPIDLNEIVEQAISLTQPRWKGQTQVIGKEVNVAIGLEKIPPICGSEAELREALTNLIFNAIDAMPDGGTITIRSRLESDIVVLEMSDTGIGMTEEVRRRCLEPFFSTKGERGTGLGLAMVSGIIRRHEATLEVESEPGKGTTFIIRLPTGTGEKTPAEEQQEEAAPVQLHILVVDDEPHVRDVIVGYLSQDGHSVATASSGSEGLRKFRASAFDLIVTDRAMPELSGEQLALVVKKVRPGTPVILLTEYDDLMKFSDELPEGVDLIVSKPPTLNSLRDAVIKAFGFASRLSRPGTSRGLLLYPADKLMTSGNSS